MDRKRERGEAEIVTERMRGRKRVRERESEKDKRRKRKSVGACLWEGVERRENGFEAELSPLMYQRGAVCVPSHAILWADKDSLQPLHGPNEVVLT